jgi:hypothetical protein
VAMGFGDVAFHGHERSSLSTWLALAHSWLFNGSTSYRDRIFVGHSERAPP